MFISACFFVVLATMKQMNIVIKFQNYKVSAFRPIFSFFLCEKVCFFSSTFLAYFMFIFALTICHMLDKFFEKKKFYKRVQAYYKIPLSTFIHRILNKAFINMKQQWRRLAWWYSWKNFVVSPFVMYRKLQ